MKTLLLILAVYPVLSGLHYVTVIAGTNNHKKGAEQLHAGSKLALFLILTLSFPYITTETLKTFSLAIQ
jgi:hypothetical protein